MASGNVPLVNDESLIFLRYANISQDYRDVLITAGITRVSHLKDAVEEDFIELYGMYMYACHNFCLIGFPKWNYLHNNLIIIQKNSV